MDHTEINLEVKQTNRRHSMGRYGIKTNKTVKKHALHAQSARNNNHEVITVLVDDDPTIRGGNAYPYTAPANISMPVSLNAHKNWEKVDNIRKSQDDISIGFRVVELDNYTPKGIYSDRDIGQVRTQLYQLDKAPPGPNWQDPNFVQTESGTNRKGFFVKQKRKRGKKGVKDYKNNSSNNGRNNNESNSNSSGSDSENDSEGSQGSQKFKPETIYIVQKKVKHPEMIRSGPFHGCHCTRTCDCGKELRTRQRREIGEQGSTLDLSAL